MSSSVQRAARSALDQARPIFDRLAHATDARDIARGIVEAWEGAERALRELAGGSQLSGQPLVRELRQRSVLALDEAHALVDFQSAADRAGSSDYVPLPSDVTAARNGFDRIVELVERDGPAQKPPSISPPAPEPVDAPTGPAVATARRNLLGRVLVITAALALLGTGTFLTLRLMREPADLARGRRAFAAGDRLAAKNAFLAVSGSRPALAEPHIYLGRMAREEGDLPTANMELRRAVELEPGNALAHRELAAYLLATNQLDLARSFYERAIRLAPDDRNALGFMGCTLARMGRFDLAPRFLQRAGPGSWQTCAQQAMQPPPPAALPPR